VVFVTGATGFLGGRLTQILHERGEEVVILARPGSDLRHLSGLKLKIVQGDLSDPAFLSGVVKDVSHIFHCAACSTDWAPAKTYVETNVNGTKHLLKAAQNATKLERFLHISTTDIYGYPIVPCNEDKPFVDAGLPYNQTKGAGEQLVWDTHFNHQLPVTILRPATIFGPRGKDFTQEVATMLRQRMMATIDGGSAPGGFTYVDNVVQAILLASASDKSLGRAYNISDGTGATWLEYLTHFARALNVLRPWINLSFASAMKAAQLFEFPHRHLGLKSRPLLTRHAVYLLGRDQEFPIDKSVNDLGFLPAISLEEGIERSAAWVQDNRNK
jgi:nucleoside-diphosphate-sugar epimerase